MASSKFIQEENTESGNQNNRSDNHLSINQKKRLNLMTNYELQTFDYLHNSQIINKSQNLNNVHLEDILEDGGTSSEPNRFQNKKMRNWKIRMPHVLSRVPQKIVGPIIKRTLPPSEYYFIKRNYAVTSERVEESERLQSRLDDESIDMEKDDDSLVSMTEVTLDRLYGESIDLQKKILYKKREGFGRRLKQLAKLQDLQKYHINSSLI